MEYQSSGDASIWSYINQTFIRIEIQNEKLNNRFYQ